ncbi:MAG TPA: type II toxin-antitoxin system VapB family antitoxin [Thermomicrobiales bacterium]|nr:type II toxin-antitoxin system VapB family antitoxin [Thermomicrobiales bacterium]
MVALHIDEDHEAYRLVRELADLRGESMTEVVTELARAAVERERPRMEPDAFRAKWLKKGKEFRAHLDEPFLSGEHGDLLYDERGLPK